MKVYLVEMDNGETHEDYYYWIEKVFTTYHKASEWLISKKYTPDFTHTMKGEIDLYFYHQKNNGYISEARINEMEVED